MLRLSSTWVLLALLAGCEGAIVGLRPPPAVAPVPRPPVGPPAVVPCELSLPLPPSRVPLRRLNRHHVERTVERLFGVTEAFAVSDEKLFTYPSNVSTSVDDAAAQAIMEYAERVVARVSLVSCTPTDCSDWLLDTIGPRLFRRPLDATQRARYLALYQAGVAQRRTPTEGAQWVLEAMLQSPSFLYLDEPLGTDGALDGPAIASRLSLALWGENPDAELSTAAAAGALDTADGVRARVRLMLSDARSVNGLTAFVSHWLELERLRQADARPDLVALGEPLLKALEEEPAAFFRQATLSGGDLPALWTASETVAPRALLTHYGADVIATTAGVTQLDPQRRGGILSLPGVMGALAHANVTSPTARGFAILSNVMCTPPRPPPAGLSVTLPPSMPGSTLRKRLEAHFNDPSCSGCHRSMDGVGFTLEKLDELGRWRELDNGQPIDDSSTLYFSDDEAHVRGPTGLAGALARRPEIRTCFTRQWMRYAAGIPEPASLGCWAERLGEQAVGARGLETLLVEFFASDYFRKGAL
ncbi:MAG: DUF1588 domain-containing protein [Myxococcales bacterium]|nr:DUF1588 domain-containing protein [Myxococcales bacterium]